MDGLPPSITKLLWSVDSGKFDEIENRAYLIHQVLRYGDLADISWLIKRYNIDNIKQIFIKNPEKVYSKPALHLVAKTILGINQNLDESAYVQSFY